MMVASQVPDTTLLQGSGRGAAAWLHPERFRAEPLAPDRVQDATKVALWAVEKSVLDPAFTVTDATAWRTSPGDWAGAGKATRSVVAKLVSSVGVRGRFTMLLLSTGAAVLRLITETFSMRLSTFSFRFSPIWMSQRMSYGSPFGTSATATVPVPARVTG